MLPPSIQRFSRIFLASLGLASAITALTYADLKTALIKQDPAVAGLGDAVLLLSLGLGAVVMLVLWFLIVHRSSAVAKWVLVALTAVSILLQLPKSAGILASFGAVSALSLLAVMGQVYAIALLFRSDATTWLAREQTADQLDLG